MKQAVRSLQLLKKVIVCRKICRNKSTSCLQLFKQFSSMWEEMKNEQPVALNCSNKVLICMRTDEKWVNKLPWTVQAKSSSAWEQMKNESTSMPWTVQAKSSSAWEQVKNESTRLPWTVQTKSSSVWELIKKKWVNKLPWTVQAKSSSAWEQMGKKMSQQVPLNCSKTSSVWELIKNIKKGINKLPWTVQTKKSSSVCEKIKQKQKKQNESTSCIELFKQSPHQCLNRWETSP